ncbi:kelch repeat protein [Histomonas meleagridis]|uniref:kelch repeat protein n=1 Tax=Histomonas meleagridis TaxID=135588 RepID=UPI00355A6541|nr:kelch repeat protein [Histomonas meleagridis]KAH0800090.1 kelch repeat protein [Histomonas meleagridis]
MAKTPLGQAIDFLQEISDTLPSDESGSYSDSESEKIEKDDSSDDILDQINKMQQEKKHVEEAPKTEELPEILPVIIAPTIPIDIVSDLQSQDENTQNNDTQEEVNDNSEPLEENANQDSLLSGTQHLLSGILMIPTDINTVDNDDPFSFYDGLSSKEPSSIPIFKISQNTNAKSTFNFDENSSNASFPINNIEEEEETETKTEFVPKEFPNTLSEFSSFICCGKTSIFLFDYGNFLLTFFAHDRHKKYQTFDFDVSPPSRKDYSIFCLSDTKIGILGGSGATNGIDLWVFSHSPIPKWENAQLLGTNFPVLKGHATDCLTRNNISYLYTFGGLKFNSYMKGLLIVFYSKGFCSYREFIPKGPNPLPRTKHTFTMFGGKMYLFGGISESSSLLDDFWILDTSINGPLNPVWQLYSGETPSARHSHFSYVLNENLYIAGGYDINGNKLNDIWRFDGESWFLSGAYDTTKEVFPSKVGLISFSPTYEVQPEIHRSNALASKFIQYKKENHKSLKKVRFYSSRIRYEQEEIQKIRSILDRLKKGKLPNSMSKEIISVFDGGIDLGNAQKILFEEANYTLKQIKSKLSSRNNTNVEYTFDDINAQINQKRSIINITNQWESRCQNDDLQLSKKFAKELLKHQIQRPPKPLSTLFIEDLETVLNDFEKDERHKNLFSHFYYINQQLQYERNEKEIKHLKEKIEHHQNKLFNFNKKICNDVKLINQIQKDIEIMKKKNKEWKDMYNEIELDYEIFKAFNEYNADPKELENNYEKIRNENDVIRNNIKELIKDIKSKSDKLDELKDIIQCLRSSFRKKADDEKKVLVSKMQRIAEEIFESSNRK